MRSLAATASASVSASSMASAKDGTANAEFRIAKFRIAKAADLRVDNISPDDVVVVVVVLTAGESMGVGESARHEISDMHNNAAVVLENISMSK